MKRHSIHFMKLFKKRFILAIGGGLLLIVVAVAPFLYRRWVNKNYETQLSQARSAASTTDLAKADEYYHQVTSNKRAGRLEWQEAAYVYQRENKRKDTIAAYQKTLTFDDKNSSVYNSLGNLYRDLKQFDQAKAAYEKAIALSPGYSTAMVNEGNMLIVQQKNDEAISVLSKYYDKSRQRVDVGLQLVLAYKQAGKLEEAKQTMKAVYDSASDNPRIQKLAEGFGIK